MKRMAQVELTDDLLDLAMRIDNTLAQAGISKIEGVVTLCLVMTFQRLSTDTSPATVIARSQELLQAVINTAENWETHQ